MNWVFIIIVGFAVFFFFKFSNLRYERVWTYSIAVLLIFLLFTFFSVVSHNELDIKSFEGFTSGLKFYGSWLWGFLSNTAKITGNVVNVDWSGNFSNLTG
ncbi:MAG: hypothetical protein Q8P57_01230 [Candidatus Pacearchaeota archaeon]|nr:hypothetical protein [Candidatus Pacearchaeota archaeon]